MNIGFDAKQAFHNGTGLGHYSRVLIRSLAKFFPEYDYFLFNPSPSSVFDLKGKGLHEVLPNSFPFTIFRSSWRRKRIKKDLHRHRIDLYHGLTDELPIGIEKTGISSVVTIHDLIPERFPQHYKKGWQKKYTRKLRNACNYANRIITVSEQSKKDIIDIYKIPVNKINVCYQSCNPAFAEHISEHEKKKIKKKYQLPDRFFLYVGSIIERKNLLNICKAMFLLRNEIDLPLVAIGDGGKYMLQVKDFVIQHNLKNKVLLLSESSAARSSVRFQSATDFPAIYQSAVAMIYPTFFEGFGIPVLESMFSKLPVITSNNSSLPEVGGDAVYYIDPYSAEEIAEAMKKIYTDQVFAEEMKQRGWLQAQKFNPEKCAGGVMNVYRTLINS